MANPIWRPNEGIFQKATMLDNSSGSILYRMLETAQKIGQAVPEKRWRVCIHPRTCAQRLSFTGNFSKTAKRISTKLSGQTADGMGWNMACNARRRR